MGELGFSAIGAAFLLALLLPNLLLVRSLTALDVTATGENRVLQTLERVGQVVVTASLLAFADTGWRAWSPWSWWLVAAAAVMALHEMGWVRYAVSVRTAGDLYRSLAGIPVPLASLPVVGCLLLGVYGRLGPLVAGALVMGVGHVGIHWRNARRLTT